MKTKAFLLFVFVLVGCAKNPETGKTSFIVTSEAQEAQLGDEAYRQILAKERVSLHGPWNTILRRVGLRVAEASRQPYEWEFKLLESKEKNAFCLPGGKVAVYTGMMAEFDNEAQLAAVIGHEVAHATSRHAGQRLTLAFGEELIFSGLMVLLGGDEMSTDKKLLLAALGLGTKVGVSLPFSRSNESEADEIGLIYMARAGYDPAEAPKFWEGFGSSGIPGFLSTHPPSDDRKEALLAQQAAVAPIYEASPKFGAGEPIPRR